MNAKEFKKSRHYLEVITLFPTDELGRMAAALRERAMQAGLGPEFVALSDQAQALEEAVGKRKAEEAKAA